MEEETLAAVLDHHRPSAAEKFVQEVFWRSYFKGWLEQHPSVWSDYRSEVDNLAQALEADFGLSRAYANAVEAKTGIDCFDHWADELRRTGYLHNHARMWFASIWVFTLELPWQLGADYFYRHLLDGDPASNTLGWRWVCGLHTKGKTYLARSANIAKFTNGRFDPAGQLAVRAKPLVESNDAPKVALRSSERPTVAGDYGLLVTTEDCHVESLALDTPPAAIVGAASVEDRSPLPVNPIVQHFSRGAVEDALDRATGRFGKKGVLLEAHDWAGALLDWAKQAGVGTVVTAYAPVGPVAEQLERARLRLNADGIDVIEVPRDFDRKAWAYADKGFFRLKKEIPALLTALGLT